MSAVRARAGLVINEFLPDPEGADAGKEFVELLNTGPAALDLRDVSLDFANGIEGPVWTTRWRCEDSLILPAGGRLLVVDRNWLGEPPGQVEVWLGLQNGPDAIRLAREGQVLDLVGYGALTDTLLMEGSPARLMAGLALARRPDGRDTSDNAADFFPSAPTPGQPNFLPFDLRLEEVLLEPPSADRPGRRLEVTASLRNTGTENLPSATLFLVAFGQVVGALLDGAAPDEVRTLSWFITPQAAGKWDLHLALIPAAAETLRVALGSYQVGPGALHLNEVLPAPDSGQGEWVEIAGLGPQPVHLEEYRLKDEEGAWLPLPDLVLLPGDLVVLAQDPAGLAAWQQDNEAAGGSLGCGVDDLLPRLLALPGAWPTLNNTPPDGRLFADRVYLGDAEGNVVDHVTLGTPETLDALGEGLSWERIAPLAVNPAADNWAPSTSPAGATPGCANSVGLSAGAPERLEVSPVLLDTGLGVTTQHLRFPVPAPAQGWGLRIFNTWGEPVRDLGGDLQGPGPRDLIWDGRDDGGRRVPQGAYLVQLEWRDAAGLVLGRTTGVSVVRRRGGS